MILDVSQFESDADKARFAHAFADRFFFRKKAAPSAVHVFIEEAQEFVPQNPQREEARMLHAFTRMEKLGRNFGIGVSLISQRPQEVNKKALNQSELLFAFQMTGPQERKTIEGWIAEKGIDEDIAGELPKLERGEPHVWSPAWLKISKVVSIAAKWTFDASSTPTVGKKADARPLAPIDLEAFRKDMAATIEKAKAEDPRELQRQVRDLQKKLQDAQQSGLKPQSSGPTPQPKRVEVPVLKEEQIRRLERSITKIDEYQTHIEDIRGEALKAAIEIRSALARWQFGRQTPTPAQRLLTAIEPHLAKMSDREFRERTAAASQVIAERRRLHEGSPLPGPQRKLLTALAQHGERSKTALALLTGYAHTGGAFRNPLSALRSSGYVDGLDMLRITETGLTALGSRDPLPTGRDLLEWWLNRLPGPETKLLRVVAGRYPKPINIEELALETEYEVTGGAFRNPLSRLRTLQLISGRAEVRAAEELFT